MVHRDIKPDNILITSDGDLKLCDMGFVRIINEQLMTSLGSPKYVAPELWDFKELK